MLSFFLPLPPPQEKLLGHLGVVLYEYLGEEYPEVLGSILAGLKVRTCSGAWCVFHPCMHTGHSKCHWHD